MTCTDRSLSERPPCCGPGSYWACTDTGHRRRVVRRAPAGPNGRLAVERFRSEDRRWRGDLRKSTASSARRATPPGGRQSKQLFEFDSSRLSFFYISFLIHFHRFVAIRFDAHEAARLTDCVVPVTRQLSISTAHVRVEILNTTTGLSRLLRSQPSGVVTSRDRNYRTMKHADCIVQLYTLFT